MIPSCFPSVQRHHYALNRSVQLLRLKMRIDFFDLARRMSKQLLDLVERSTILHKPRGERVPQDVEMNSLVCELGLLHIALEEMSHSILIYLLIVQSEDVIGRTLALLRAEQNCCCIIQPDSSTTPLLCPGCWTALDMNNPSLQVNVASL